MHEDPTHEWDRHVREEMKQETDQPAIPACPKCHSHEIRCDATATANYYPEDGKWTLQDFYIEDHAYTVCGSCGHELGGCSTVTEGAIDFDASGPLDDNHFILLGDIGGASSPSVHNFTDRERDVLTAALRLYQTAGDLLNILSTNMRGEYTPEEASQ